MIVGLTACGSSNEPAATASTDSGNTVATTAEVQQPEMYP